MNRALVKYGGSYFCLGMPDVLGFISESGVLTVHLCVCVYTELDHGLSEPQIRCISRQLFEALDFLHASHCIHRDLKAGNILLCPDGSIRLGMDPCTTKQTCFTGPLCCS